MSVGEVIDRHRLVVTVGTGGVGKTTLAAAIAIGAAARGRRAMVLTIDPARALARALGLDALAATAERIELPLRGTLHAGMLDQKAAWDAFIERHAPGAAVRRAILDNPFYGELSRRFAGATEFVAVEELCRLHESGRFDLIVLDTPPAAHALDFVTAPTRIDRLLDPELSRWLTHPGVRAGRAAGATIGLVLRRLERATGRKTLRDISAFFSSIESMFDDVRRRSREARGLLHGPDTAFVLVTGPGPDALEPTLELDRRMRELELPLCSVVANRMHPIAGDERYDAEPRALALLARAPAGTGTAWLESTYRDALTTARAEHERWLALGARLPAAVARATIPELDHDLCALDDLALVGERFW